MSTTLQHVSARVHGEYAGDPSTAAEVTMYESGSSTARALASDEQLCIMSLEITSSAAVTVTFFADADDDNAVDAGEVLARAGLAANGQLVQSYGLDGMVIGKTGGKPHVLASATSTVNLTFEGFIRKIITKTP